MSLQYSDDSEGSQLRDLVDNDDPQYSPMDNDRPTPPSPRTALLSMASNGDLNTRERSMRSRGKEPERRHKSHRSRNLVKILLNEEYEVKQTRRVLSAALDRLDSETQRAQEAERRALEMAERFKIVNDARISAQQEARRAIEELQMYKVQLDNAQREINRASDLLRDIEAQRDDAEAAAARARTTARRLREQQLVYQAREDGRKQGYEEGMKRGYDDGRAAALSGAPPPGSPERDPTTAPRVAFEDDLRRAQRSEIERTAPLAGFPSDLRNFPPPPSDVDRITLDEPESITVIPPPGEMNAFQPGAQGSRFREEMTSPGGSTINMPPNRATGPQPWPAPPGTASTYDRSPSIQNRPLSLGPSDYTDTLIPEMRAGENYMNIPPPHGLSRPYSSAQPLPTLPQVPIGRVPSDGSQDVPRPGSTPVLSRDYAYAPKNRMSPGSLAESLTSTTMSQFDLLSSPRSMARRVGRDSRGSGLSAIQEVPTSMEFSPSTEAASRRNDMPEPVVFPVPSAEAPIAPPTGPGPMNGAPLGFVPQAQRDGQEYDGSPRSRRRLADQLRYSNPNMVDEWRRSASESLSPPSGPPRPRPVKLTTPEPLSRSTSVGAKSQVSMSASSGHHRSRSMNSGLDVTSPSSGSKGRRSMKSSDEFVIQVEPPSGAGSTYQSPTERMHAGLLSPDTAAHALPPQHMQPSEPLVPTVPNSPRSGGNMPSMGSITSVSDLPWNFIPAGQPVQTFTVPPQRVQSVGPGGSRAIDVPPTHTPSIVSPSAVRATGLPSSRPHTPYATAPTPPGLQYPSPLRMGGALPQTGTRTPGSIMAELPPSLSRTMSPRSTSSRLSGHQRSLSMNAGSTPAAMSRTLAAEAPAPAPALRRIPSTGSIASNESRHSSNYARYESREFVDPAFLASSEDLGVQSPNTMANTRANAVPRMVPGPRAPSRSSSRMSYMSGRSRE